MGYFQLAQFFFVFTIFMQDIFGQWIQYFLISFFDFVEKCEKNKKH